MLVEGRMVMEGVAYFDTTCLCEKASPLICVNLGTARSPGARHTVRFLSQEARYQVHETANRYVYGNKGQRQHAHSSVIAHGHRHAQTTLITVRVV